MVDDNPQNLQMLGNTLKEKGYKLAAAGSGSQALEFIEDDELVEVAPSNIRVRKRHLKEHERKRAGRGV